MWGKWFLSLSLCGGNDLYLSLWRKGFRDGKAAASHSKVMFMGTILYNFPFPVNFSHALFDLAHNSRLFLGNSPTESQNSVAIYSHLWIVVRFLAKMLTSSPIVARFLHKANDELYPPWQSYNPLEYKCIVSAARLKLYEFAGVARRRDCERYLVNTPRKRNIT